MIPLEKPGSPAELVHHGVLGQKWGVRRGSKTASSGKTPEARAAQIEHRKQVAKKVAIGTGVLVAVAGTAYVGYKLNQSGHLPLSSVKHTPTPAVKKILKEPTDVIHASRGHNRGFRFFKEGGTPDYFKIYDEGFGGNNSASTGVFKQTAHGIAASFADPEGRKDRAGRVIPHEVIIPKSMTTGINNLDDVKSKIWPLIKDTYVHEDTPHVR